MIRAYSQRLLPPFSGVVQIAESPSTRAQSFDGVHWDIHYLSGIDPQAKEHHRVPGYGRDRGYYKVAHWADQALSTYHFPACLESADVARGIEEIAAFLATAEVPFNIGDVHECWLLDAHEKKPLALLFSCCDASQIDSFPPHSEWIALPHSKMQIDNSEGEQARGEAPVNHRFQRLIARRAGMNAKTAWFNRDEGTDSGFPSLLVREDWADAAEQDLCERYLQRKAPRLLMLHGLPQEARERMEVAAKKQVFEVEEYYRLYPQVNDERRLKAMRVEARLRRAAPDVAASKKSDKVDANAPLSKDMRIIEN